VLKGVRATGYLSERGQMLKGGAKYTGTSLERDGLIITSSDSSATTSFARAIVTAIAEKR
jgi:putative intracellular protease/amidase